MRKVLVTGATGFVGRQCCRSLSELGHAVIIVVRDTHCGRNLLDLPHQKHLIIGDIGPTTAWNGILEGIEVVVHLAARVHVMREKAASPLTEFRRVNSLGTEHLARSAARAGVQRFVYLSTIKVNGETTVKRPFTEQDRPAPCDPYAVSKWEAEQALQRISLETGLEVVVIRLPLVYGPGVRGNFLRLVQLISGGVPLPFGSIKNSRSLLGLTNLVDLISTCVVHHAAANQTFLVSDREPLSTPALIAHIAAALQRSARLLPFPPKILQLAGSALRMKAEVERFCNSLVVDSQKVCRVLRWSPPISIDEEMDKVAEWFRFKMSEQQSR